MRLAHRLLFIVVALTMFLAGMPASAATVHAVKPIIHLSRLNAGHGDHLAVSGTGFTAGDLVAVFVTFNVSGSIQRVTVNATVTPAGTFGTAFTVPPSAQPGVYLVTARDQHARSATSQLSVLAVLPLVAGGAAVVIPVIAGHSFYVRAVGFGATENVTVDAVFPVYHGASVTVSKVARADQQGKIPELLVQVPVGARVGDVAVGAAGAASGKRATGSVHVVYRPHISTGQGPVAPGGALTIIGRGFVPSTKVHFSVQINAAGGAEQLGADATSDRFGSFQVSLAIPGNASPSTYRITATDRVGNFQATAVFRIAVVPRITLNPPVADAGRRVTVSGANFTTGSQVVVTATFVLAGGSKQTVSMSAQATGAGTFSAAFVIPPPAAAGATSVVASGGGKSARATLTVRGVRTALSVSPPSSIPGATVTVSGTGYAPGEHVMVRVDIRLANGGVNSLSLTTLAGPHGGFQMTVRTPPTAIGGSYVMTARGQSSGRSASGRLQVAALTPTIVAVPAVVKPGDRVSVHGFGFPAAAQVSLIFYGQTLTRVQSSSSGEFSATLIISPATSAGPTTITAQADSGQKEVTNLTVTRTFSTHLYVSSLYTGTAYHEYITLLNPSDTKGRVTITYDHKDGGHTVKSLTINPHSRLTEDVNADLGQKVSAAAQISADVPLVAERAVFHGTDGDVVPAATRAGTSWYFANGNTGKGYREYLALQNPNARPVRVAIRFLPAHNAPFTIYRTLFPTSRLTVKVNTFVAKDAVGLQVTSNAPIVANRTIFIYHGMTSTDGVAAPGTQWYFASGPTGANARTWIALINPSVRWSYVTLRAYGQFGRLLGMTQGWVKPNARAGYLINRIAGQGDAAVVLTASRPVVAEQMTYVGTLHNASTDTFGTPVPAKIWSFATANTATSRGEGDTLDLFNPGLVPAPIVVTFILGSGASTQRTYVLAPFYHQHVDVAAVVPNSQLGLTASSSVPFVALNRGTFNSGNGGFADGGMRS